MAEKMTLDELRDYIRNMPDDEILCITFEDPDEQEEAHDREKGISEAEAL